MGQEGPAVFSCSSCRKTGTHPSMPGLHRSSWSHLQDNNFSYFWTITKTMSTIKFCDITAFFRMHTDCYLTHFLQETDYFVKKLTLDKLPGLTDF